MKIDANSQNSTKNIKIAKYYSRHDDYFKILSMQRMKGVNIR